MLVKLLVAAALVLSASASLPTTDPLDPDRRGILEEGANYTEDATTKVKPQMDSSPAAPKAKIDSVSFDKVKFALELVGGTLTAVCVVASIIYAIRHGESVEAVLARHLPLVLRLWDIWRPGPRVQADLIDL